ncbi:unnamed protein product [Zymoseptoria tritici ST99CH_1A5]|uniref:Rab-GAP TBC domain-containing protein n=4 Tax=Zymoseptoria tritici TaxID=1047171 RepID=A0A1X7RWV9_ZYMT9|nr:unnamed protein product [Zymoseptoria tritici ST99CH_3D7]SMR54027.1 unnamed protein product [Zymoseptoria tritici ST99CH_1E4]SMR56198.1 unnamed protein product [Zymoseptoria tritici ST99CH_3D1]SMY25381.1 unnamed protein product [Zymoseptoria tritici ST99CH_1A5]
MSSPNSDASVNTKSLRTHATRRHTTPGERCSTRDISTRDIHTTTDITIDVDQTLDAKSRRRTISSHLPDHPAKRDSGIAPPTPDDTYRSPKENVSNAIVIPLIVVEDEEIATSRGRTRTLSKEEHHTEKSVGRPRALSLQLATMRRMSSFKGLDTELPSTSAEDGLNLGDLASEKLSFSNRGSLLFGGKKMQDLISSAGDGSPPTTSVTSPSPPNSAGQSLKADSTPQKPTQTSTPTTTIHGAEIIGEAPIKPLVSGRRKPSVQMLQAALNGGRVLSAEEISFSLKVRSMYEHGDERAAEWVNSLDAFVTDHNATDNNNDTPDEGTRSTLSPTASTGDLTVLNARCQGSNQWPLQDARSSYISVSKYSREAHELAGGVEDWADVDGRAVDRYGFIKKTAPSFSGLSTGSSLRDTPAKQLKTSHLHPQASQTRLDRMLNRKPSVRSSRSVPPRPSGDWTVKRGPASLHSTHSNSARAAHPFRSRRSRILAEAPDMLIKPPSLADISEHEDAGKTASTWKRREWAREEKWQRMARRIPERNSALGGGMSFDFDASDPKVIDRTWKGIPDRWRATAWHSFLATSAKRRNSTTTDAELIGQFHKLQEMSCVDDVQIDVDVPRTVNLHIMFRRRYRGGQRLLFRVLHAISLYFPDTGYVQGMASIAATLLCYYDEENAFAMMVRMWQLRGMEAMYADGFEGLMTALKELETEWVAPEVSAKLEALGVTATSYGTRWYLTLFNMSVPFPAQLRIWDVFMLLGDAPVTGSSNGNGPGHFAGAELDVLHATSAALIDATRGVVLESDFEEAMQVLTSFVQIKDEDLLMKVARTEWKLRKKRAGIKV